MSGADDFEKLFKQPERPPDPSTASFKPGYLQQIMERDLKLAELGVPAAQELQAQIEQLQQATENVARLAVKLELDAKNQREILIGVFILAGVGALFGIAAFFFR